jgi:hypothetical protein
MAAPLHVFEQESGPDHVSLAKSLCIMSVKNAPTHEERMITEYGSTVLHAVKRFIEDPDNENHVLNSCRGMPPSLRRSNCLKADSRVSDASVEALVLWN